MNKWLIIFAILLTACTGTSEKSEECITIDLATHMPGKLIWTSRRSLFHSQIHLKRQPLPNQLGATREW